MESIFAAVAEWPIALILLFLLIEERKVVSSLTKKIIDIAEHEITKDAPVTQT